MFRENLKKIVESVDGGVASLLMGFDGIAIDSYVNDAALDIMTVGMEFSFILGQVKKAAESLEIGNLNEIVIRTEKVSLVMRIINNEYFLALALDPEKGNFGKGRYVLRVVAPKLEAELS